MIFNYEWLRAQAAELGLSLSQGQIDLFKAYERLLKEEAAKYNLTAVAPERLIPDHFLDSLSPALCGCWPKSGKILDIGSGAGFPGLPLKIAFPKIKLTLLESRRKKEKFLEKVINALHLESTKVLPLRAEAAGRLPAWRGFGDIVVARAVAALPVVMEYALPLLRVGGWLVALKGPRAAAEVEEARAAAVCLGGEIKEVVSVKIIPGKRRNLVLARKTRPTPERYPRRVGIPAKRPLSKSAK